MNFIRGAVAKVAAALLMGIGAVWVLQAAQNSLVMPTTGTVSGLQFSNLVTNALDSLLTCNSGTAAPTNALGGVPKLGQCWIDTTVSTLPIKKRYTGSAWVPEGVLDVTNGLWVPPVGGGIGSVASAGTTNLCTGHQAVQSVTGSTGPITSFGSTCPSGVEKTLVFSSTPTVTHNATSMILPGGVSITVATGDVWKATHLGGGNWRVIAITRLSGLPVAANADLASTFALSGDITTSTLSSGNNNDYAPAGLSTASIIRITGDAAGSTITGLTGGADGRIILIHNAGAPSVTVADEGGGSTAANRFTLNTALTLLPGKRYAFQYDAVTSRWIFVGQRTSRLNQIIHFTSNGTYTAPTNLDYVKVAVCGGGGGGGGAQSTAPGTVSTAGGGGGGGMAIERITAATIGASQTVTIGAAGTAGTGGVGGTGGTTSLGALISATGGAGGTAPAAAGATGAAGGLGGTGSGGDANFSGHVGGMGLSSLTGPELSWGYGAAGCFGGGAAAGFNTISDSGTAGSGCGAGGAGSVRAVNIGTAGTGGAGVAGCMTVEEFTWQ